MIPITSLAIGGVLYVGGRVHGMFRRNRQRKAIRQEPQPYESDCDLSESGVSLASSDGGHDNHASRSYFPSDDLVKATADHLPSSFGFSEQSYIYHGWHNIPPENIPRREHAHRNAVFEDPRKQEATNQHLPPKIQSERSVYPHFTLASRPYEPSEQIAIRSDLSISSCPVYPYSALQGAQPIRLIELHPAKDQSSDLHCSFYQADLVDKKRIPLSYEAVSYAWGKADLPNVLFCDDTPSFIRGSRSPSECQGMWHLRITESLDCALRAFRSTTRERTDGSEKMHQVRQMKRIYQEATRVLIWLGEEGLSGGHTLRWLEELGQWRLKFLPFGSMEMAKDAALPTLQQFFLRSWFRRRWVIQEVTHSRTAILSCGQVQCDWKDFAAAIDLLYDIDSRVALCQCTVLEVLKGLRLMDLMKTKPDLTYGFGLLDSLNLFHASDTARAQDRILALVSFSENPEAYIDFGHDYYKESTHSFYTQFARNALERTQSLDILHLAGTFRTLDNPPYSATWIPDWCSAPRYKPFLNIKKYSAGIGPSDPINPLTPVIFGSGATRLILDGILFGNIVSRSDPINKSPCYDQVCNMMPHYCTIANCAFDEDDGARHALATTLIADQGLSERFPWLPRRTQETEKQLKFRQMLEVGFLRLCYSAPKSPTLATPNSPSGITRSDSLQSFLDTPRSHKYAQRYAALVSTTMNGRCLFRTASGHIGIGPEDLRPGDCVVIFVGARTPFVVRHSSDGETFEVVGDCYVHGIMNGEALGKQEWRQFIVA
ncbi:hypothetical protein K432DRAFT_435595 [Lepidopterella palustris CBS 459.81]|uniref:Heterokaryon incompatibility domain-containing protein n=1 Tax=Lepidopterella palustris CBS 459.81 TaxID=1314670 RepID=A0A8E2JE50_9PEZI|nr:hypothetical protein K432DRAFT_435595 [Lepidopterella palustris CBS 459.81]